MFSKLTLGHHRRRCFADRIFANWSFADRVFADWRRLYNRLRMRQVRRQCCAHKGQACSTDDQEFQHRSPPAHIIGAKLNDAYWRRNNWARQPTFPRSFFDACCRMTTRTAAAGQSTSSVSGKRRLPRDRLRDVMPNPTGGGKTVAVTCLSDGTSYRTAPALWPGHGLVFS